MRKLIWLARMRTAAMWFVSLVAVLLLWALATGFFAKLSIQSPQNYAIRNCKEIITSFKMYSSDNNGKYPDSESPEVTSSNAAFRALFRGGQCHTENIFGCPGSIFKPDGEMGVGPDYERTLNPGENHWAMTKGLSDEKPGEIPLVFENPLLPEWPPHWSSRNPTKAIKGHSWKGGMIVIGLNDSSVALMKVSPEDSDIAGLRPGAERKDGKNLFEAAIDSNSFPKGEILDVEVAPAGRWF